MTTGTAKPFRVAVTGHRPNRLPQSEWTRIRGQLDEVMAGLEARHSRCRFVLLSGLAEGADRLAANVALARGWALIALLPFSKRRHLKDFPTAEAKAEFRALLKRAEAIHEAPEADAYADPTQPYAELGDRLLASADALLVIWDGAPSQGRGGTVDVMEQACAKAITVIRLDALNDAPPQWLGAIKQQHL